jgi:hypothetical protein
MNQNLPRVGLDDGSVIQGDIRRLSQNQLISYANQLYRNKRLEDAYAIMVFQHEKFHRQELPQPPQPTEAA